MQQDSVPKRRQFMLKNSPVKLSKKKEEEYPQIILIIVKVGKTKY